MSYLLIQGDAEHLPLPDRSVDLVFGSPPYVDCRLYLEDGVDLGIARGLEEWVSWMLRVTDEALRVSRGAVLWVACGKTEDRNYWPACEGLMWEWHRRGGHAYRPCYWHRNGIFGSGGDQWFRSDVEYAMCFKRSGELPWANPTACGNPPKFKPGGEPSHRKANGSRVDKFHTKRQADGTMRVQGYTAPEIANPGNLISTGAAGGGRMGHPAAHLNEAPFPEDLAEFFLKSLVPPGGSALDPFSGSGTTVSVAQRLGMTGIGVDLRASQHRIARQRIERPHAPVVRKTDAPDPMAAYF